MAGQLRYQTIQVENRMPARFGPSARGAAVGAGVKLLHKSMKALNGFAVSWRVNREIEKLRPQIERAIQGVEERMLQSRPDAGVLVVAGVQEWATPDPTGTRAQTFLSIHIGGAGTDPAKIVKEYIDQPRMVQGPSQGWRRRDLFIWVTRTT